MMADGIGFEIKGLDEVLGRLDSLSEDVKYKGGRFALRKAANLIREKAIQNALKVDDPATPEVIAKNIVVRWSGRAFKRTGDLSFRVGVLGGARGFAAASGEMRGSGSNNPGGDTYYWRYLEFGTRDIPARPFMRSALSQNFEAATAEFVKHFGPAIDRALKRAKKS